MSAKHTPGPWKFEPAPCGGFDIEKDPNDLGRYMVIASRNPHPKRAEEMHANGRLIAAAPDLLEALETALTVIKVQRDLIERNKHNAAWNPVIEVMSAAIAKARGQS